MNAKEKTKALALLRQLIELVEGSEDSSIPMEKRGRGKTEYRPHSKTKAVDLGKLVAAMKKYNPEAFAEMEDSEIKAIVANSVKIVSDLDGRKHVRVKDVEKLKQLYNF